MKMRLWICIFNKFFKCILGKLQLKILALEISLSRGFKYTHLLKIFKSMSPTQTLAVGLPTYLAYSFPGNSFWKLSGKMFKSKIFYPPLLSISYLKGRNIYPNAETSGQPSPPTSLPLLQHQNVCAISWLFTLLSNPIATPPSLSHKYLLFEFL